MQPENNRTRILAWSGHSPDVFRSTSGNIRAVFSHFGEIITGGTALQAALVIQSDGMP
jgi:hypothetical protein